MSTDRPVVHFRMDYGTVALQPGAVLERAYDELALVATLQGIVNRAGPRLYLRGVAGGGEPDLDAFWWERMAELGWEVARARVEEIDRLEDLLARFGEVACGLVVWDPRLPATQAVAATVAAVEDLLPVARRPAPSLYADLVAAGWCERVRLDAPDGGLLFTGTGCIPGTDLPSSGSSKCDAYLWAKAHYLDRGRCSPLHLAYYIDAHWLQRPGAGGSFWNNTLVNHDYYVGERAFFCDLDPWEDESPVDDPRQAPGTDGRTLRAILCSAQSRARGRMLRVGGFPPWAFKYTTHGVAGGSHDPVPTEWRFVQVVSEYDGYIEADALGMSAQANASFTRHLPLAPVHPQRPAPRLADLVAAGWCDAAGAVVPRRFFAFYVGDFDAPSWLYQALPRLWNDPDRGRVPLSWAVNPNLSDRMAPALAWMRATATPGDSFVAGDSGAGYVNPGALEPPRGSGLSSGVATWAQHCAARYRQWDLQATGFVLEGFAPRMGPEGVRAYAGFSPGGIVGQGMPAIGRAGAVPVADLASHGVGHPGVAVSAGVAAVQRLFAPLRGPQFAIGRAILMPPAWYLAVTAALESEGITVVDLVTLLALIGVFSRVPTADPACLTAADGAVDPAGLRPVPFNDGRFRLEEVDGRTCLVLEPAGTAAVGHLYLLVEGRDLLAAPPDGLTLEVRYRDPAGLSDARPALHCTYPTAAGPYTPARLASRSQEQVWRQVRFDLDGATLWPAQNGGSHLRLSGSAGTAIAEVRLVGLGREAWARTGL